MTVTKNTDSLLLLLNPTVQALTGLLSLTAQADSLLIGRHTAGTLAPFTGTAARGCVVTAGGAASYQAASIFN